eukprot:gene23657-30678_t
MSKAIIFIAINFFAYFRIDATPLNLIRNNVWTNTIPRTYEHPLLDAVHYFSYTGSAQIFTVPIDVNSICIYMWGGGGYEGAGAYVEGIVCTLNITVAGAGFWNTGISGEDIPILIAEGGRGSFPPSIMNTVRQTLHSSDLNIISAYSPSYTSLAVISAGDEDSPLSLTGTGSSSRHIACKGQHSKYYNPSACGRGGSRASQNGFVVIELDSTIAGVHTDMRILDDVSPEFPSLEPSVYPTGLSLSPSMMPTYSPSTSTSLPTDSPTTRFIFIIIFPLAFISITMTIILVRCYSDNRTSPIAVAFVGISLPMALATVERMPVSDEEMSMYLTVVSEDNLKFSTAVPVNIIQSSLLDAVTHFSYTGSAHSVTVPLKVNSISVYLWGGGGYEGAGAYVEGTVHVYPGCTLNITVAGAGSWNTGVGCGGSNHECYEEGGKSALQISGEDMPILIAKGGRGRSPPYSSSQSSPSYTDTVRHTLYKSLSSSRSGSIDSGGCNGQHSKYYNHAVCGRGGSRA